MNKTGIETIYDEERDRDVWANSAIARCLRRAHPRHGRGAMRSDRLLRFRQQKYIVFENFNCAMTVHEILPGDRQTDTGVLVRGSRCSYSLEFTSDLHSDLNCATDSDLDFDTQQIVE
ncbi:hypothetical protein EVAR_5141_1 [Eumeta japonica]|uniref:Uncharacterized protein n=1 Tax=Eumeta variegata TaxID=151549 RepID=A0A4C1SUL8_EUMVA|nr:hypothetical protein EVAR_5141_1 [Eumeta japonica]